MSGARSAVGGGHHMTHQVSAPRGVGGVADVFCSCPGVVGWRGWSRFRAVPRFPVAARRLSSRRLAARMGGPFFCSSVSSLPESPGPAQASAVPLAGPVGGGGVLCGARGLCMQRSVLGRGAGVYVNVLRGLP